jgi:hypothetical protein
VGEKINEGYTYLNKTLEPTLSDHAYRKFWNEVVLSIVLWELRHFECEVLCNITVTDSLQKFEWKKEI